MKIGDRVTITGPRCTVACVVSQLTEPEGLPDVRHILPDAPSVEQVIQILRDAGAQQCALFSYDDGDQTMTFGAYRTKAGWVDLTGNALLITENRS